MKENNKVVSIARKNLELMKSYKEGGMVKLLLEESWGGNAGKLYDGRSCAGANFYFDENGEIKYFGNLPEVPKEIYLNFRNGILRVATNLKGFEIIECWVREKDNVYRKLTDAKSLSETAKKVLQMSIQLYNLESKPNAF